jgi:hypothetical protein
MKKTIILFLILVTVVAQRTYAQSPASKTTLPTTIGMVISSNDTETVWNALRLANFSKNKGDKVSIFLLGKGVELDNLVKTNNDLKVQVDQFLENGGTILGCGTCLKSRKNDEPQVCQFSSMADLYDLIRMNNIVLTF